MVNLKYLCSGSAAGDSVAIEEQHLHSIAGVRKIQSTTS